MSVLEEFSKRKAQNDMQQYARFIEMVPIETLKKYMHVDRVHSPSLEPEEWDELKQSVSENGWTEPLIMIYFSMDNAAVLGEGNHRLAIAEQLGLTEIPIRVVTYSSYPSSESHYAGAAKPVRGHPKAPGYVPADLKPSDIGLI